jgi:hypothetical protein
VLVATRTVYVKNDELWETAKSVAGTAGLSNFVEEALQRLVTAKQLERKGVVRFEFPFEPLEGDPRRDPTFKERIGFEGQCLVDWGSVSVYLTKGGTFIVTRNACDAEGSIYDYHTHDQLSGVRRDPAIACLERDDQSRLWNVICEALPPSEVVTWID